MNSHKIKGAKNLIYTERKNDEARIDGGRYRDDL